MECEICGRKTDRLFEIYVEGTNLRVCSICSKCFTSTRKFGKKEKFSHKLRSYSKEMSHKQEYDAKVVGDVLRKIRMRYRLTQKQLSQILCVRESIIRRIERGELKPDASIVRRVEKQFKVEIQPERDENLDKILSGEVEDSFRTIKQEPLTLGDVVKIRVIKRK